MSSSDLNPASSSIVERLMEAKPALAPAFRDRLIYEAGRACGKASSNRTAWTMSRLFALTTIGLGLVLFSNVNSHPLVTNTRPSITTKEEQAAPRFARMPASARQILRATDGWVNTLTNNEDHSLPRTIGISAETTGASILTPAQFYVDANSI